MGMVVPNPRTWVDGELVSPEELNTEIRDAINFVLNPPAVAANLTTPQTIPDSTWTTITFNLVTRDTDSISDLSTLGTYTIQTPGLYLLGCNAIWASNTSGVRHVAVFVNGVNVGRESRDAISSGVAGGLTISKSQVLTVGDVVEFKAHQNTGAGRTLNGAGDEISSAFVLWCAK